MEMVAECRRMLKWSKSTKAKLIKSLTSLKILKRNCGICKQTTNQYIRSFRGTKTTPMGRSTTLPTAKNDESFTK